MEEHPTFLVAIPSYKRAETLKKKTLACLRREGIPKDIITVFLASEEEFEAYKAAGIPELVGKMVIGMPGIHRQREVIHDFYPEGQRILSVDDDVSAVRRVYPGPLTPLLNQMFAKMDQEHCRLGGIYPTDHGLCLRPRLFKGLAYCIGAFHLLINWKGSEYPLPFIEDYVKTLECFKMDGAVLRFEGLGATTRYFKEPGGLQEFRTLASQEEQMRELVRRYPGLAILRKREGKMTDARLRRVVVKIEEWGPTPAGSC